MVARSLAKLFPGARVLLPHNSTRMERLPEESSGPTPHQVFCWTAEESSGATYCPVFGSSLKGALCLGDVELWGPEMRGTGLGSNHVAAVSFFFFLTFIMVYFIF